MKRKEIVTPAEKVNEIMQTILNADQACNEFRLQGTTRVHVLKKFKDQIHTTNDWSRIFREERVC